jgi:hypothetical protein
MNDAATTTRSTTFAIGASIVGAAVIAGATATLMLAFGAGSAHAHAAPAPAPAHHAVAPTNPPNTPANTPANTAANTPSNTPVSPPAVPALPAEQVETLQRQLGQLNYYEGPI